MVLEILVSIKDNKKNEFIQLFELLSGSSYQMSGRTEHRLFEEVGRLDQFLWKEQWNDAKSLESYFHSNNFRALLGAILVLGKLNEIRMGELSPLDQLKYKPNNQ
jgi:quinol monooxygenase YgiN